VEEAWQRQHVPLKRRLGDAFPITRQTTTTVKQIATSNKPAMQSTEDPQEYDHVTAELRKSLSRLRPIALHKRCIAEGIDAHKIEDAMSSSDVKVALIELLVATQRKFHEKPRGVSVHAQSSTSAASVTNDAKAARGGQGRGITSASSRGRGRARGRGPQQRSWGIQEREKGEEDLTALLGIMDADGDGRISKQETKNYLLSSGLDVQDIELEMMWKIVDEDGNGTVGEAEFLRLRFVIQKLKEGTKMGRALRLLNEINT
jgi:hypothetical protein